MRVILFFAFLFCWLVVIDAWKDKKHKKHKCTVTILKYRPHETHTTTRKVTDVTGPLRTKTITKHLSVKTIDTVLTDSTTFTPNPATVTETNTLTSDSTSTTIYITTEYDTDVITTTPTTTTTTTTTYTESYSTPAANPVAPNAVKLYSAKNGTKVITGSYIYYSIGDHIPISLHHRKCKIVTRWIDHTKIKTKTIDIASGTLKKTIKPVTTTTDTLSTTTVISLDQVTDSASTTTTTTTTTTTSTTTTLSTTTTTSTTATATETAANYPFCNPSTYRDVTGMSSISHVSLKTIPAASPEDCCRACGDDVGCPIWSWVPNDCSYFILEDPSTCGTALVLIDGGSRGFSGLTPCASSFR